MTKPPWDQGMANDALVIEQCVKLGGVVLHPKRQPFGFQDVSSTSTTEPPTPNATPSMQPSMSSSVEGFQSDMGASYDEDRRKRGGKANYRHDPFELPEYRHTTRRM